MRLDDGKFGKFSVRLDFGTSLHSSQTCPRRSGLANNHEQTQSCLQSAFIWRMSVKTSIVAIEKGLTDPKISSIRAIETALEAAGIEFDGGNGGIRPVGPIETGKGEPENG